MKTATFYGGPLDDRTFEARDDGGPRWPTFLGDDGHPISNEVGDAEYSLTDRPGGARRYYMHQLRDGGHVYVHLSVWPGWYAAGTD